MVCFERIREWLRKKKAEIDDAHEAFLEWHKLEPTSAASRWATLFLITLIANEIADLILKGTEIVLNVLEILSLLI